MTVKAPENILFEMITETSLSRLRFLSRLNQLRIIEFQDANVKRGSNYRTAVIMVSSRPVRIIFQVQFSIDSALFFAKNSFKEESITSRQAEDFMREYCNHIAGHLKGVLINNAIMAGLSLSTVSHGTETFLAKEKSAAKKRIENWGIQGEEAKIYCAAQIETFNTFSLKTDSLNINDNGDVEFL